MSGGICYGRVVSAERREMRALMMSARSLWNRGEDQLLGRMEGDPGAVRVAADGVVEVSGHCGLRFLEFKSRATNSKFRIQDSGSERAHGTKALPCLQART